MFIAIIVVNEKLLNTTEKKQASEAGKASAAKRKERFVQQWFIKDDQSSNENSTVVENPLNEEQTGVQPTNNHKPLTINQEPIIDSSSNTRGKFAINSNSICSVSDR